MHNNNITITRTLNLIIQLYTWLDVLGCVEILSSLSDRESSGILHSPSPKRSQLYACY